MLRWLICSSFSVLMAYAASVTGRVELRDSRDPAVRRRHDYSGVVVLLQSASGRKLAMPASVHAKIIQKDKTFTPHVLAIPVGSTIDFPNLDPIFHNAFSSYSGQIFDIGLYPPGSTRSVRFTREGVVRVFCNIHSSMSALIVVLATPFFAVTRSDGSFEIRDVPPGQYELSVFHERASEATLHALTRTTGVGADPVNLSPIVISEDGYLAIPHKNKFGRDYPQEAPAYPGMGN